MLQPSLALVGLLVTGAPSPDDHDRRATETSVATEAEVVVRVRSTFGDDGNLVGTAVRDRVAAVLLQHDLRAKERGDGAMLVVALSWPDEGGTGYHVRLGISSSADEPVAEIDHFVCGGCGGAELLDALDEHIVPLVPRLRPRGESETPTVPAKTPAAATPSDPSGGAERPVRDDRPRRRRSPPGAGMEWIGFSLAGIAGPSLIVGGATPAIILGVMDQKIPTSAWALIGSGVGAIGIGLPIYFVGRKRLRRNGYEMVFPPYVTLGPGGRMLSVGGRF